MQKLCVLIVVLFLISNVCSLAITEVELNPKGDDSGHEWIEFYSKEEVSLDDYKIMNNDGGEISLSGSFSGYYVYVFGKQWLDNSDERIFLYKEGKLIDKTDLLEDSDNDDKTWQSCDDWEFLEETKNKKNGCEDSEEEIEEEEDILKEEIFNEEVVEENELKEDLEDEKIEEEMIILNSKDIKTEESEELDKNRFATYGLIGFCLLLGFLFLVRQKFQIRKNEFR